MFYEILEEKTKAIITCGKATAAAVDTYTNIRRPVTVSEQVII